MNHCLFQPVFSVCLHIIKAGSRITAELPVFITNLISLTVTRNVDYRALIDIAVALTMQLTVLPTAKAVV